MPTSQEAIHRFLSYRPDPPPQFRGADPERLHAIIEQVGNHPLLSKTPPRPHQLEGLAFALWAKRALLYYAPRTGKTLISLDWLSYLIYSGRIARKALIIAHAPVGLDEWEHQIPQHSHLDVAVVRSGREFGSDAQERFFTALAGPCDAVLTAWPTLQQIFSVQRLVTRGSKLGKLKLYADHPLAREAAARFDAVVIDEIHMAGHHDTLRFAIAKDLVSKADWRLGLTGTPFGRDPLLLWAQAFLIDDGETLSQSFYFFREATGKPKFNPFSRQTDFTFDPRNMAALRDKMSALSLSCELADVQEVNVIPSVIHLAMAREQQTAYREAIERMIALRSGQLVEIEAIFVRLRQIASGFLPFENDEGVRRVVDFDSAKLDWLDDLLGQKPDFPIVVFHCFTHSGERICKLLAKHKIKHEWLYGGSTDRRGLIQRFQSGQSRVLVANVAAGGLSINLSAAEYMVFYENDPSLIIRKQAEARPLARGSRPLVIDDLVCAPIERKILDFHAQGRSLLDVIRRDPKRAGAELAL